MATVGIHPNDFDLYPNKIPPGRVVQNCPEVTLDTFGLPVGGRLATRRAVSWPRLPKVALLGFKNATFLARNQFSVVSLQNKLLHYRQDT